MFTPNSSRQTLDAYFKSAMMYDLPRLQAVMQGKDSSIPQAVAMMAMQVKKPLVDAAKAQQAGQQPKPPSVKEGMQAEAQMLPEGAGRPQQAQQGQLPEQAGIGALPAQNMQGMGLANGGIIAFAEGGDTDLFRQPDEVAYADANQVSAMNPETSSGFGRFLKSVKDFMSPEDARKQYDAQQKELKKGRDKIDKGGEENRRAYDESQKKLAKGRELLDKEKSLTGGGFSQQTAAQQAEAERLSAERMQNMTPVRSSTTPAPVGAVTPVASQQFPIATESNKNIGKPTARTSTPKTTKATTTPTPAEPGAPALPDADYERLVGKIGLGAYEKAIKDNEAAGIAGIKTLRDAQKEGKPTGKAFEGLEKSLKKEEGEVADKENQNVKMALVEAGFAMAAGDSPYALTNIARGGQAGTKAFKEGKEKLQKAADRRQELNLKVEEARRAEERDDYKTKIALEKDIFALERGIKSDTVAGLKGVADISTRVATDMYNQGQETLRANERNKVQERISDKDNAARLQQAKIAYGSRGDPADMMRYRMTKEVNDTYNDWVKNYDPLGVKRPTEAEKAAKMQQLYAQFGIQPPAGVGAAPTVVAAGDRPKFDNFFK